MIKRPYESCIKINGKSIIAPLMTAETRHSCNEYKRKAIELEKRRERSALFQTCMTELADLQQQTENLRLTTLENQLVFADEIPTEVPSKLSNLTRETIDISEYSDDGLRLLSQSMNSIDEIGNYTTPRLVRSNSYTLANPSPILLAHIRQEAQKCRFEDDTDSISPITVIDENESPVFDTIQADITVHKVSLSPHSEPKSVPLEPQLLEALSHLPESCAKSVIEILEKQREQWERNKLLGGKMSDSAVMESPMSVSISSQSLYYSISSPDTTVQDTNRNSVDVINFKNVRNREDWDTRKEKAASVIGAAVRGYLVRRLIKTEKVQGLIETIKDALMCAIQLHSSEIIDESDIELHRRLLQQVSAACYEFHDVFFALTTKQQMVLISQDRQRRIDRANRRLSSTRSSFHSPQQLQSPRMIR